jgi:folate-binding protein YgfZ
MIAESAQAPDMSESPDSWPTFLQEQGLDPNAPAKALPASGFVAPLTHLGLIALDGEQAVPFLHSQLSNDVEHLDAGEARLAAYCSPKGRMLASLLMWRREDRIFLQLPRDILPAIQKRLQMFVLRAKVKLADVSEEQIAVGVSGAPARKLAERLSASLPNQVWGKIDIGADALIRVADAAGQPRYQWITTPATARAHWPLLAEAGAACPPATWRLSEIEAGVPMITQATQEQFVPQMINFELLGGVNFKKGCYPGQEIVARSQYLGKLKRRMYLAELAGTAAAGAEVFSQNDPQQPAGMLVNVEASSSDQSLALVELKSAVLDQAGSLHVGAADGPLLKLRALPYPLPDPA